MTLTVLLFGIVVLLTHFIEGVTGFGCTVLALPFCTLLVGVKTAIPVLTALSLILAVYIVAIDHHSINWPHYWRIIALVGLGLPLGMLAFSYLPESILKKALGIFMVSVASRGIWLSFRPKEVEGLISASVLRILLFLGGIIHGAFSTGGPFIIVYAAQVLKNKFSFRATLSMVWLTLNTIVVARGLYFGSFTAEAVKYLLFSVPFLVVGMLLGNWALQRIQESLFIKVIYLVLFVSGFFMFA